MSEENQLLSAMIAEIGRAMRSASLPHAQAGTVDVEIARRALTTILAMMLEADPEVVTHQNMREECHRIAREIRPQLGQMRNDFRRTGYRSWDAIIARGTEPVE